MAAKLDSEMRFHGLAVSGGMAYGRTCLFGRGRHEHVPDYRVSGEGIQRERDRLRQAVAEVVRKLDGLKQEVAERVGPAEAEIFTVQRMILQDPTLDGQLTQAVDAGFNAETAVLRTLKQYEARLIEVDSAYHAERASDLGELRRRLLEALGSTGPAFECAEEKGCRRGRGRIVITDELTPALAMELDADTTLGIVTDRGGVTSHAAILVRALGIPAVSGIPNVHELVACGSEVLLDGDAGEVVVWPSAQTAERFDVKLHSRTRVPVVDPVEGLRVMANISIAAEARLARAMKAEGIGLYRTELEFFAAGRCLDEQEQADRYAEVLAAMHPDPVYFRLLDIGGDKPGPVFDVPPEDNPSLGLRGMRFLLARPEVFRTQARALARTSAHGPVYVMYPMIVDAAQFRKARRFFDEATADLPTGDIHHGVMFEVPSAALDARALLAEAAFGSVGSNDLVQYLFAVDRNNEHVAGDYSPDRDVFWRLLGDLVRAADEAGCPLSLCGELAADPAYTARLIELGIRTVSVSARLIPGVRQAAEAARTEGRTT